MIEPYHIEGCESELIVVALEVFERGWKIDSHLKVC